MYMNSRFPNVALPILQIFSEFVDREAGPISFDLINSNVGSSTSSASPLSNERMLSHKSWRINSAGFVPGNFSVSFSSPLLPATAAARELTVRETMSAGDLNQAVVVSFIVCQRHMLQFI